MSISDDWVDPDDVPELPKAWFDKAALKKAGVAVPEAARTRGADKERVALQIDADILQRFRAAGPDWQARINAALRSAVGY